MAADHARLVFPIFDRISAMTKLLAAIALAFAFHPSVLNALSPKSGLAPVGAPVSGTWTGDLKSWDSTLQDVVYLSLQVHRKRGFSQTGSVYKRSELAGFDVPRNNDGLRDVRFRIEREAGVFNLEGRFDGPVGAGTFRFEENPAFRNDMAKLGFPGLDDERVFSLAMHDVTTAFIKELRNLGYSDLTLDVYESMRIHDVTPEFVRDMASVGFPNLDADEAISFRIHDVSRSFVSELKSSGLGPLTPSNVVSLAIHDVDGDFIRGFTALGYTIQKPDDAISLSIHDVSPEFAGALQRLGYRRATVDQLVSLSIHDVDETYIEGLAELGYSDIPLSKLIDMSIHDVTLDFVSEIRKMGYRPSADQLVKLRIQDVSPDLLRAFADGD